MTDNPQVHVLNLNLYDAMYPGGRERGALPLRLLGFDHYGDVGRFRDAWIERTPLGTLHIHIYVRNGGGNREAQAAANTRMQSHPWFSRDEDDTFDSTYASFYFLVPPDMYAGLNQYAVDPVNTGKRWADDLNKLDNGTLDPAIMQRARDRVAPMLQTIIDSLPPDK